MTDAPMDAAAEAAMTDGAAEDAVAEEQQPFLERRPLRISLGILFFMLIMIMAVLIVGIVSVRSLISHEEAVTEAWNGIQTIVDRRQEVLTNAVRAAGDAGHAPRWRERWVAARDAADTAPSFVEEVPAVAALDAAADRVVLEIRQSAGIDSVAAVASALVELDQLEASLGLARRAYNERVREYLAQRSRIPVRWFATLFGYEEVPEYFRVVVR